MTRLDFEPIYDSVGLTILVISAVLATIWWVAPPTASRSQRRKLIALRVVAAMSLIAAVVRPSLVRTDDRPAAASIVVAADQSLSMQQLDDRTESRWERQAEVWRRLAAGLQPLADRLRVELVLYDREIKTIDDALSFSLDAAEPVGLATDLSAPLRRAVQSANTSPLEGVILIGDGNDTAVASAVANAKEPDGSAGAKFASADESVQLLGSIGVPVWTIPIGPPAQNAGGRDVAIEGLPESLGLFAGNDFEVGFELVSQGLAGTEIPIRLRWVAADGTASDAAARRIVVEKAIERQPVRVRLASPAPGSYRLEAKAATMPGETLSDNNTQVAFVDVRPGGGRVLLVEGQPRPEQRFLRLALSGLPGLDLTYRWIQAGTESRWPIELGDDLALGKFDIVILGDIPAAAIGTKQLTQIAEAVRQGDGLLTLGGAQAYSAGAYDTSPIAEVLPVRLPDRGTEAIKGPIELTVARPHPVTDVGEGPTPWSELPKLAGASPLGTLRRVPGAAVLLESQDQRPMLAVREFGSGRVASLAIDETYRWYRGGHQAFHRRFWRQLMLWLLDRDQTDANRIDIQMDSRRFASSQSTAFTASLVGSDDAKSNSWNVRLVGADGEDRSVDIQQESVAAGLQTIAGELPELPAGFYSIVVSVDDPDVPKSELAFQVIDDNLELANPQADPVFLKQLANLTSDQGGRAYRPDQVDELVQHIADARRRSVNPIVSKRRLGDGPISGWILFAVFAAGLITEWVLRRRYGLA